MISTHQHSWQTSSSHRTSDGLVTYQSCRCGRWRILTAADRVEVARSAS
jgi:hypothetical protein